MHDRPSGTAHLSTRLRLVPMGASGAVIRLVRQAAETLVRVQEAVTIDVAEPLNLEELPLPLGKEALTNKLRQVPRADTDLVIGVVDEPLAGHRFGVQVHQAGIVCVTTHAWGFLSPLPTAAYVLFQCGAYLLRHALPNLSLHADTRGCIQDLCTVRRTFNAKLVLGEPCPTCAATIQAQLAPHAVDAVMAIMEEARREALGKSQREHAGLGVSRSEAQAMGGMSELVDARFPFPLAWAFRAQQWAATPERRWFQLSQLFDATCRYLIALGMSASEDLDLRDVSPSLRDVLPKLSRASLGIRLQAAIALEDWFVAHPEQSRSRPLAQALAGSHARQPGKQRQLRERLWQLVQARNDTYGHGAYIGGEEEYQTHVGTMTDWLDVLRPLADFPLVWPLPETLRVQRGRTRFKGRVLMGSHTLWHIADFDVAAPVGRDIVVLDGAGGVLALDPWLLGDACSTCRRESLWAYESHRDGKMKVRELVGNHDHVVELDQHWVEALRRVHAGR